MLEKFRFFNCSRLIFVLRFNHMMVNNNYSNQYEYVLQVCNAVYVRLNYTQPLCACPSRYKEPCSASLNADDLHTTELSTDTTGKVSKTKMHRHQIIHNYIRLDNFNIILTLSSLHIYYIYMSICSVTVMNVNIVRDRVQE